MSLRRFVIWRPENGQDEDDGIIVCAYNAEEAVARWARWDDAHWADYHIVGGQPAKVMARDSSTGTATEWIVSGESVPHYSARETAEPRRDTDGTYLDQIVKAKADLETWPQWMKDAARIGLTKAHQHTHEARRWCHGDDAWSEWQPCTTEQAAWYRRDETFQVRAALRAAGASTSEIRDALGQSDPEVVDADFD